MSRPAPVLAFLGATGTVTGSRFLIDTGEARILVDCGMFQGLKRLRQRNWDPPPVPPGSVDAVVLTHAHLDHSGMLPALVRDGFAGPILASPQTAELATIVVRDSGHLQEEEAEFANRRGYSKHQPARPLYTEEDALAVADRFRPVAFGTPTELAAGVTVTLRPAGHILGSATAEVVVTSGGGGGGSGAAGVGGGTTPHRLLFSGDLGRGGHPILRPPAPPPAADTVLVESTYGNRQHEAAEKAEADLAEVVSRTASRGGTVVIPSFAVDRTEVLLWILRRLRQEDRIPALPVYADSPMALAVLDVYRRAIAEGDPEVLLRSEPGVDPFDPGNLHEIKTPAESRQLDSLDFPSIIISASGMATGGRVLHHLERCLPDKRCSVVLPGFQAEATRGRLLADGAKSVKLFGQAVPVRAEIHQLDALSGHADANEVTSWLGQAPSAPGTVYVIHGEPDASRAMADRLESNLGWHAVVPTDGERVTLG